MTSLGPGLLYKKKYEWDFAVDDNFTEGGLDVVHFLGFGASGTKSSNAGSAVTSMVSDISSSFLLCLLRHYHRGHLKNLAVSVTGNAFSKTLIVHR